MVENVQRQELKLLQEAKGYERMHAIGMSNVQIAEHVGKNRSYIISVLKLVRHPGLETLIHQGVISVRMARVVARLLDAEGHERMTGLYDWFIHWVTKERPTIERAEDMVRTVLAAGTVPILPDRPSARPMRRQSLAEREWERWETQVRPVLPKHSRVELQEWHDTLMRMVADTQRILDADSETPRMEDAPQTKPAPDGSPDSP